MRSHTCEGGRHEPLPPIDVRRDETIKLLAAQQAWDSMNIIAIAAAQASLSDAQYVVDGRKHNAAMKADVVASLQKVGYSRPARGRTDSRLR